MVHANESAHWQKEVPVQKKIGTEFFKYSKEHI